MKINRRGQVRLQKGDHRTGNFIFHDEGQFIKVTAISGIVSWRVYAGSAIGELLTIALKERRDDWLKTYAAMNFSQLMVIPDHDYFVKHSELVNAQAQAHPEFYGKHAPVSDEEDKQIIEEERELNEELDKH